LPDEAARGVPGELRNLQAMGRGSVDARTRVGRTAGAMTGSRAGDAGERVRRAPAREIADIDAATESMIAEHPEFAERREIPIPAKGIGPTAASAPVRLMPGPGGIGNRRTSALVGVAPAARDSGAGKGRRRILCGTGAGARPPVHGRDGRVATDPGLREFHERPVAAGKAHRAAIVAVMRKPVVMPGAFLRDHGFRTAEPPVRHPVRRPARSDSGRAAARRKRRPACAACG